MSDEHVEEAPVEEVEEVEEEEVQMSVLDALKEVSIRRSHHHCTAFLCIHVSHEAKFVFIFLLGTQEGSHS